MAELPKKPTAEQALQTYFHELLHEDSPNSFAAHSAKPSVKQSATALVTKTISQHVFAPSFFQSTPVEEVVDEKGIELDEAIAEEVIPVEQPGANSAANSNKSKGSDSIEAPKPQAGSLGVTAESDQQQPDQYEDYAPSVWLENGRPTWAQDAFDLLLFQVNGFSLAVPLVTLGQIYDINDELTPLIGQSEWFMGYQPTTSGKVRVVNTALYVMPERYDRQTAVKPSYVLTIDKLPWGLGINSVDQPVRIKPDAVKWRTDRSKQPWMAGVVKDHMCVLLDVPTLGRRLLDSDRKRKGRST